MNIFEKQLDSMYFNTKDDLCVSVEDDGKLSFSYHEPKNRYNEDAVTTIFKLPKEEAIKLASKIIHYYAEEFVNENCK